MKLKLVKQGDFLGTKCDFYINEENEIFMSRTQIGYALQYKQPQHAILMVHQRHKDRLDRFSVEVTGSQIDTPLYKNKNADKVFMYKERGIYEVCRWSNQKVADDFNDWVYDVILSIKKKGFYISSEKDSKWLGTRQESKEVRKIETDIIKEFISYAKSQGSQNADRYYILITNLVNKKVKIESNQRDKVSQQTLLELKGLETIVKMHIKTLIDKNIPYKQIFQEIKSFISKI